MKSWKCSYCDTDVSEMGAYVKMTLFMRSHLDCYKKAHEESIRAAVRLDALQAQADDAERQKEVAIAAWRAAIRCPKCGVPMLSERPKSLPEEFSTVLSSNGSTCTLCVRQEAGLRAAARGREAPAPPSYEGAVKLARENAPKVTTEDEELVRKARESGNPAIEVD